jgi:ABC-type nitrate/sulfonate/bicarbonate transport system substrate-binding protein
MQSNLSEKSSAGPAKGNRLLSGGLLAALLAFPAWGQSAAGQPAEIRFSIGTKAISFADLYAALDRGLFKNHNLNVVMSQSSQPPGTVLLSGAAQISSGQPAATYVPDAAGADIVAIYSPAATFESWVASAQIKSPKDLQGKVIGVFNMQDLDVVYTRAMMQQFGIPNNAYSLVAVGLTNAKLAATVAGKVDAAPLYPPAIFVAADQGLNTIFDTSMLTSGQFPIFYVVRRSWAEQHSAEVVEVISALNEAHTWLFDPANKQAVIDLLVKYTGAAPVHAAKSYDLYFSQPGKVFTKNGEWDRGAVESLAKQLIPLGLIPEGTPLPSYESTVAPQYRERAAKSAGTK